MRASGLPHRRPTILSVVVVLVALLAGRAAAQEEAAEVRTGTIDDDLFVAGSSVNVGATIAGDLFAAGGWVDIHAEVADNLLAGGGVMDIAGHAEGDLFAVGGMLDLAARVGDNLVAAGGIVSVEGEIAGKLFVSAGRLRVGHRARVARGAWLAAGSADVAGVIAGDVVIAGGPVTLRGRIDGDVEVTALSLELAPGTRIGGRLLYYGPDPPEISERATVTGGVEHRYEPESEPEPDESGTGWPSIFWLAVTLGLGLLLDLILPRYVRTAGHRLLTRPVASFGLGLAILFVTPVMIVILVVSVLGFAIGVAAVAAYGTLLLLGPVVALFAGTDLLGRWLPVLLATDLRRRLLFVALLVILGLIGSLPWIGTPALWAIAVLGLGAATWQLYESVRGEAGPPSTPAARGVAE